MNDCPTFEFFEQVLSSFSLLKASQYCIAFQLSFDSFEFLFSINIGLFLVVRALLAYCSLFVHFPPFK